MSNPQLRIDRLTAQLVELPFRFSFGHALAKRSSTLNIVVAIRLTDGTVGYGEGVPREYVTGETAETAITRVTEEYASKLFERDVPTTDIAARLRALRDGIHAGGEPAGAAWCAVETALLDAIGHAMGRSAADLLGGNVRQTLLQFRFP